MRSAERDAEMLRHIPVGKKIELVAEKHPLPAAAEPTDFPLARAAEEKARALAERARVLKLQRTRSKTFSRNPKLFALPMPPSVV